MQVVYLSPDGDPLWFSVGKGSDVLVPTGKSTVYAANVLLTLHVVYTLWKEPNLLPFLSTPAPVVPKLIGGADLMIPGGQSLFAIHKNLANVVPHPIRSKLFSIPLPSTKTNWSL